MTPPWLSLAVVSLMAVTANAQQGGDGANKLRFGGGFDSLAPEQQELVRLWDGEYEHITGRQLDPRLSYDNLPLATRTTFDAVTNALLHTPLTDASTGASLGTALSCIKLLESVHGEFDKTRGDQQYRIYVRLADDALPRLYRSKEFKRTGDNTIYHLGYPINFRQQGGAPSIQFSVARTGFRADIDVDYRPSSGPVALVNGHLTAANSDVRAGDNFVRHSKRWQGLTDWWKRLFGFTAAVPSQDMAALSSGNTPPRLKGSVSVQEAAIDFYRAWLLEDKPELALPYVSIKSLACIAEFGTGETAADSLVRLRIYRQMKEATEVFGKVNTLDEIMQGVHIATPGGQPVTHQYGELLSVQRIPDDVARNMDCRIRYRVTLAEQIPRASHELGGHYQTMTILGRRGPGASGQIRCGTSRIRTKMRTCWFASRTNLPLCRSALPSRWRRQ